MYKLLNATKDVALREGTNVLTPRKVYPNLPATVWISTGYIQNGTLITGDRIETLTKDVYNTAGVRVALIGDKWLHVNDIGGYSVDGYTAVIHMGNNQGVLTEVPDTPPPSEIWPPYFIQETPDGKRARYNFSHVES